MREALLAVVLVVASGLTTAGVALISTPAAFIVAGLLVAVLGYLFLVEAD